ncbi:MAG TPA: redoxin domain-containing protein [Vicinamibacteria bacterium]
MVRLLAVLGCLVVAALVVLGFYYSTAPPALRVHEGEALPDLELPDFTGQGRLRLYSLRDRPLLVVVFDTSWPATVPYLRQMEKLRALYQDRGLVVIGISTDADQEAVDNVFRTEQINFYVLRDPRGTYTRPAFGSPTPPTPDTFVVAPGLKVTAALAEPVDWRNAYEHQRIEAVLPPPGSPPPSTARPAR